MSTKIFYRRTLYYAGGKTDTFNESTKSMSSAIDRELKFLLDTPRGKSKPQLECISLEEMSGNEY